MSDGAQTRPVRLPPVGGQAVLEGVMMRTPRFWSVAVRRPNGEVAVVAREFESLAVRRRWLRLPVLRGVLALGESMAIGFRALGVSAQYAAEEEDAPTAADGGPSEPEELSRWSLALSFVVAIGVALLLFKVGPGVLTGLLGFDSKGWPFLLVEGAIRIAVFIAYLAALRLSPELRRVFAYHAAEHKAINALEAGRPLEPATVNRESLIHVRCGTAFLLWVMVVAIVVYGALSAIVGHLTIVGIVLSRIVLLPVIAGIAYEVIRLAGKHGRNPAVRAVLAPGLWLQRLTTRPCDDAHCDVAIRALDEVLERERGRDAARHEAAPAVDVMA